MKKLLLLTLLCFSCVLNAQHNNKIKIDLEISGNVQSKSGGNVGVIKLNGTRCAQVRLEKYVDNKSTFPYSTVYYKWDRGSETKSVRKRFQPDLYALVVGIFGDNESCYLEQAGRLEKTIAKSKASAMAVCEHSQYVAGFQGCCKYIGELKKTYSLKQLRKHKWEITSNVKFSNKRNPSFQSCVKVLTKEEQEEENRRLEAEQKKRKQREAQQQAERQRLAEEQKIKQREEKIRESMYRESLQATSQLELEDGFFLSSEDKCVNSFVKAWNATPVQRGSEGYYKYVPSLVEPVRGVWYLNEGTKQNFHALAWKQCKEK